MFQNDPITEYSENYYDRECEREYYTKIVEKISGKLTEDNNEDSSKYIRDAIRDLPQTLTVKRNVEQEFRNRRNIDFDRQQNNVTTWLPNLHKYWSNFKEFVSKFQLWSSQLRLIEGKNGSSISAFFHFYRWLFGMNVFAFLLSSIFIVLPQILKGISNNVSFSFSDLFSGEGFFENSLLFYGSYSNGTIKLINFDYNIPQAYLFTMVLIYFTVFIILCLSTAKSYKTNFIETKGGFQTTFAQKVFTGWDFKISEKNSAELKSKSLGNDLNELLEELSNKSTKVELKVKIQRNLIHLLFNVIVLSSVAGIAIGIWYLKRDVNGIGTAVVINLIMYVLPLLFTLLLNLEAFKKKSTKFFIKLARTFLLEAVVIGVVIGYWLYNPAKKEDDNEVENNDCWQTNLGQEIYRFIIFDFIFCIIFLLVNELFRCLLAKYEFLNNYPSFDVARHTLQLTYNQSLFWIGLYFSPLLPVIILLKLFITWYFLSGIVLYICKESKSWRAQHTHTWFRIITFFSFVSVVSILVYINSATASHCGPLNNIHIWEQFENGKLFWTVVLYITKPGVVALILLAMILLIYYLKAKVTAQESIMKSLNNMIKTEVKQKKEYLDKYYRLASDQHQSNEMDPIKSTPQAYIRHCMKNRQYSLDYDDFDEYNNCENYEESFDSPQGFYEENSSYFEHQNEYYPQRGDFY